MLNMNYYNAFLLLLDSIIYLNNIFSWKNKTFDKMIFDIGIEINTPSWAAIIFTAQYSALEIYKYVK